LNADSGTGTWDKRWKQDFELKSRSGSLSIHLWRFKTWLIPYLIEKWSWRGRLPQRDDLGVSLPTLGNAKDMYHLLISQLFDDDLVILTRRIPEVGLLERG
jgi:hypothetical protein